MQKIFLAPEFNKSIPWRLVLIFIIFSIAIIVGSFFFYKLQRNRLFIDNQNSLTAISTLKVGQIEQWHSERMGDALTIRDNEPLIRCIKQYFDSGEKSGTKNELTKWMESLYSGYDYSGVSLMDTLLKTRLSFSRYDSVRTGNIKKELSSVLKNKTIILTDLHRTLNVGKIHIDLIIPLIDPDNSRNKPFGVLILRIDPDNILFPLIQSWPTPSKSSETLILRRDGDSVTYLNQLRHLNNTALNLKLPLTDTKLLASKAIDGQLGVVVGIDYRNKEVVGCLSRIPDFNWYMVAKVDKEEIQTPLKRFLIITLIVCVLLILINASVFGFFIWSQRVKMYRMKLKDEQAIRESEERFNIAFLMSPVTVTISTTSDNKFIDINNTFLRDMEYSREEVIGHTAKELDIWADESERSWVIDQLSEKDRIFGKVLSFKTKTGKVIYGLTSMSVVMVNGNPCNLTTVVNITEIRKAEAKLTESEELFRKLFENMLNGFAYCKMIYKDGRPFDFIYINVNTAFESLTGLKGVIGKTVSEVIPGIQTSDPQVIEIYGRVAASGNPEVFEIYIESLKMWFSISVYSPKKEYFVSVFDVITERKNAEAILLRSEERFRGALDNMLEGCQILDFEYRYLYVNDAADLNNRRPKEELLGNIYMEMWPGIENTIVFEVIKNCMENRISHHIENEFVFQNGESGWFDLRIQPVPEGVFILSIEITDRKLSEEALRRSEKLYRAIGESINYGVWVCDPDGRNIYASESFLNLVGITQQECSDFGWGEVLHPDDSKRTIAAWKKCVRTGSNWDIEHRFKGVDGEWHHILARGVPVRDGQGQITSWAGINLDISGLKKAEDQIRLQSEILSHMAEAVYLVKMKDGIIVFANSKFESMFGYEAGEMIGKQVSIVNAPTEKTPEETAREIMSSLAEKGVWTGEVLNIRKDGTSFWTNANVTIFDHFQFGEVLISVQNDITDQKNAELQIKKLNEVLEEKVIQRTSQLEAVNKELEAFSYSVSHDLRAPLRSVHGYTKILMEEYENKLDDEGKRICKIITESATQMGGLIDDLLSFSRIGRSNLNPAGIDMKKMVSLLFEGMTSPAERERITITIGKLQKSYGDVALIGQVWINLLSNAIKYSSKKEVPEILVGSFIEENMVTYFVRDNGVGFDMTYAHKLFGVFQRLHTEREFEGNGVGLAIVQRIILKHSGKVWAEGEVGKGATFSFSLPIAEKTKGLRD